MGNFHILERLKGSFEGSMYALSKRTYIFLLMLVIIPCVIAIVVYGTLTSSPCIQLWTPLDFPDWNKNNDWGFCRYPTSTTVFLILRVGVIYIAGVNILFGTMFVIKLKRILKVQDGQITKSTKKFKDIMTKNTLLTLVAVTSTLVCFFIFIPAQWAFFVYLDRFVNSLIITLMFGYNNKRYKKLCKCCIRIFNKIVGQDANSRNMEKSQELSTVTTTTNQGSIAAETATDENRPIGSTNQSSINLSEENPPASP